jgi:hypothetical protein
MDIVWHVIYFAGTYRSLTLIGIFILSALIALFFPKIRARIAKYYPLIFILAFLNVFFGSGIAVRVVHAFGEKGTATITGSYSTSNQYNNHDVVGYHVLLKAASGKVIETSFEDDDFNIYPPKNGVIYPNVGDNFTVYYLRWFPKDFIIVDNDDSPWAAALRCGNLRDAVQEANTKYEFDRNNASYREAYIAAIKQILAEKCGTDEEEIDAFHQDIANIEAGEP